MRVGRALRWGSLGACALLLSGCIKQPATEQAKSVHELYFIILALAAFVFVTVEGLLVYSIIRFRRRDEEEAPQRFGSNRVLGSFFAIGAVLVAVLFPFGERALMDVEASQPPGLNLRIEAFQWEWTAFYLDEGIFSTGKTLKTPMVLELPVDIPIHVTLVSRDVMHEFYVPEFLFMRNAIPGHPNRFTFTPTRIGTFQAQCAEFCGLWHSRMTFVVKVVAPTDFAAFVKHQTLHALGGHCKPTGPEIRIVAKNSSWDTNCIAVPEHAPLSITVANEDDGVDHNFAIYPSLQDGIAEKHEIFASGAFPGVETKSFDVPQVSALHAGRYYFQCNIHGVAMAGAFIVGNEPPGGGGPPPGGGG
jgi:cytochrome c oxidase subunit II